ncbi:MAG TPA: hypothetical protein VJN00_10235, partial [Steroidobacteraceae bacterium]|nr:hypothetical protein [Steroidobacteraceae bacterium]
MAPDPLDRLKDALGRYVEPNLGMTLAEAGAVQSVSGGPEGPVARIVLGFPVGGYEPELARALDAAIAESGIDERPRY